MREQVLVFRGAAWQATHYQSLIEAAGVQVVPVYVPITDLHELYVQGPGLFEALRIVHGDALRLAESRTEDESRSV